MDPEDGAVSSERGGLEGWRASAREEERERERERERENEEVGSTKRRRCVCDLRQDPRCGGRGRAVRGDEKNGSVEKVKEIDGSWMDQT